MTEEAEPAEDTAATIISHTIMGQGDPLLQEMLKYHNSHMINTCSSPLYSELHGHGDPLMEAFIEEEQGDVVEKQVIDLIQDKEIIQHDELKKHGDTLLRDVYIHDQKVSG